MSFLGIADVSATVVGWFYALDGDVSAFRKVAGEPVRTWKAGGTSVQEFSLKGHRVHAVKMGSGSVTTAANVAAVLARQNCDLIVSTGPVGGLTDKAEVGMWHRVTKVVPWQAGSEKPGGFTQATGKGWEAKQIAVKEKETLPKELTVLPILTVASGEVFVNSTAYRTELATRSKADAVEMNLFGLVTAVRLSGQNARELHLRVVSDLADDEASEAFQKFTASYDGQGGKLIARLVNALPEDKTAPDAHPALKRLLKR